MDFVEVETLLVVLEGMEAVELVLVLPPDEVELPVGRPDEPDGGAGEPFPGPATTCPFPRK